MKKNDRSEFYGKELDELEVERQAIENAISFSLDNASLANSVPGQKLIKRLTRDVDVVRKRYYSIKGTHDEQLAVLHRLQGREQQLIEELENLTSAARFNKELGLRQEIIMAAIEEKKKEVPTR
jgi:hypothetical protein